MKNLKKQLKKISDKMMSVHENSVINEIIKITDFQEIKNEPIESLKTVGIVITSMEAYAGGHTSILRLGTNLAKKNLDVHYIYTGKTDLATIEENAKINLKKYQGNFVKLEDVKEKQYDLIIATSWKSVYYAKNMNGYKCYFVQDYEPYFFKVNERYFLAKKTYELGFHIISLGKWNVEQIKKNCHVTGKIDFIDFPYESSEYQKIERNYDDYKEKQEFTIAVYAKEEGKRIPNLIQNLLQKLTERFQREDNITLNIEFFGFDKKYKPTVGKNLGKLKKDQLQDLYKKADFGMVASMTNISLVPYEMIATGLPIIEFSDGSFKDFFPEDAAILIDFDVNTLYNKLNEMRKDPSKIEKMTMLAYDSMKGLSWENSVNQFYDIIKQNIK